MHLQTRRRPSTCWRRLAIRLFRRAAARLVEIALVLFPMYLFVASRCWAAVDVYGPRPGNVFFAGEPVRLAAIAGESTTVTCDVYDHRNHLWARRTVVLTPSRPRELNLGRLRPGWYRVVLTRGGQTIGQTAFCVIRRYRGLGCHDRLFGVCISLDSQQLADFLSLAGITSVRRDWGWPTVEPFEDQWRPDAIREYMARARDAGIDFMAILGYAPRFTGQKPIDATSGRPATAGHTWPISSKRKWIEYLRWCKEMADSLPQVQWPPQRLDPDAPRRLTRPAVCAWEIWNEVDQNFYYGPWHQYCDLLRLAHAVLDTSDAPVLYGGSCGHWTEMGMALSWSLRPFFDLAAGHPGGDVDDAMPGWAYGAQSISYKYGAPYDLVFTEAYFHPAADDISFPDYAPVLYAKLRHWDIEQHYAMQAVSSPQPLDTATRKLFYVIDGRLVASPAYAATAFARWLMLDAAYAGRFSVAQDVEAYAFVRLGQPVLLVWATGSPKRVDFSVQAGAQLLDNLGRIVREARGDRLSFIVPRSARVIVGCSWSYIAQAASARFQEYLSSQFGAAPREPRWSGYVGSLEGDLKRYVAIQLEELQSAAAEAFTALERGPSDAILPLRAAAGSARRMLLALAPTTATQAADGGRFDTIWRAAKMVEWLCELCDQVQLATGRRLAFSSLHSHTMRAVSVAWQDAINEAEGSEKYHARSLARRALQTAERARRLRGPMLSLAARIEGRVAQAIAAGEAPVTTRILAVAEFPDAPFLVKGHLIEPGRAHTVRLLVCNFTPRDASVTVRVQFPGGWEPGEVTRSAKVSAGSVAVVGLVSVTPPVIGEWEEKRSWRPAGPLVLLCPKDVPTNQQVMVQAEVSGRPTAPTYYYFNVGRLQVQ